MTDTVKIYKDDADEWRWSRISSNGNILADSGEGYKNRVDCVEMAHHVNGEDVEYV